MNAIATVAGQGVPGGGPRRRHPDAVRHPLPAPVGTRHPAAPPTPAMSRKAGSR
jgi:hypothetical protein